MAQYKNLLPTVAQVQNVAQDLIRADSVLAARIDAQVTASTDSDADYAAEVADGRADYWGNKHASLGANIRDGQRRTVSSLSAAQSALQRQIDDVAMASLAQAALIAKMREQIRTSNQEG